MLRGCRKKYLTKLCLPVLLVLFFGCRLIFWTTYHDQDNKFSIQFPRTWQMRRDVEEVTLMLRSPLESKEDPFRENVTITVAELPEYLFQDPAFRADPVEIIFEAKAEKLLEIFSAYPPSIERKPVFSGGHRGRSVIFDSTIEGRDFKIFVASWVANQREYTLVFTAELEKYPRYKDVLEDIVDSFTIR